VIDLDGKIDCIQYGESMADIPTNEELFKILDSMN
jgi:hypothetical protein